MRWQHSPPRDAPLLLIALLFAKQVEDNFASNLNTEGHRPTSSELVESLRRELMVNNYDYLSPTSEELPARRHQPLTEPTPRTDSLPPLLPYVNDIYFSQAAPVENNPKLRGDDFIDLAETKQKSELHGSNTKNDFFYNQDDDRLIPTQATLLEEKIEPRGIEKSMAGLKKPEPRGVDKNDLLYYVDNDHLIATRATENYQEAGGIGTNDLDRPEKNLGRRRPDKNDLLYYVDDRRLSRRAGDLKLPLVDDNSVDTTPQAKYKVLKVKEPASFRRSGGGGYRRFIQEQKADGVAVISLDNEPIPPFRLPRARRQFMAGEDVLRGETSLEIALPSDQEGDDIARLSPV